MHLGDFNAKSSRWCVNKKPSLEGFQIECLTSSYSLTQVITEPTHLLIHSGVHSSLHKNCYHQITFAKLDLRIEYLPPYKRLIWNYKQADTLLTSVTGKMHSLTLILIKKVEIFNKIILNMISNYCASKTIICNDKNPPWLTGTI